MNILWLLLCVFFKRAQGALLLSIQDIFETPQKEIAYSQGVVSYTFNPSTWEVEAGRALRLKVASFSL